MQPAPAPPPPARAARAEPSALLRVACFLPDRVLDLLDMVSFGIGIGYGFDIHRQVTCLFHVPTLGMYKSVNLVNWYYKRNLCMCTREETEFGLLPFVLYRSEFFGGGTGWDKGALGSGVKEYASVGLGSPGDPIHEERFRDPWAIGVHYGPVLLSPRVELELHPVEIVDFLLGLVSLGYLDVTDDDWLTAASGGAPRPPDAASASPR